jgi:hypothetical protein
MLLSVQRFELAMVYVAEKSLRHGFVVWAVRCPVL